MIEHKLIAACIKSRDAWERCKEQVEEMASSPQALQFLELCSAYYANDGSATHVDVDWLNNRLDSIYDNPKKAQEYKYQLGIIVDTDVSIPNIVNLLYETKKKELAHRLAAALTNQSKEADDLLEEYQRLEEKNADDDEDEVLHNYSAEQSIAEVLDSRNRIRLPTKALTDSTDGGAAEGDHIVVAARPEVGKTALCVSFARTFSNQGLDGLYFGNEDAIKKIASRAQSCFSGLTKEQIIANPGELNRRLKLAHWDKVKFIPAHGMGPRDVRRYVKLYKPKWLIMDQARNMVMRADTRANQLESIATEMRNIAGEFGLVGVSVTQAGDSAENKLTLGMGDIDSSNCLARDTEVLMFDGSKKKIQDIVVGEQVRGMDNVPRTVTAVGRGRQPLYKITHKNEDSYTVNQSHIMTLYNSDTVKRAGIAAGAIGDLALQHLLNAPYLCNKLKGIWTETVEYDYKHLPIDPYLFGLWLADGFSHTFSISTSDAPLRDYLVANYAHLNPQTRVVNEINTIVSFERQPNGHKNPLNNILRNLGVMRNKRIPDCYLHSHSSQRLRLLAGIIDGDGSMRRCTDKSSDCFTILSGNNINLAEDTLDLCKSLGFYSSKSLSHPTCWAVRLSGLVNTIPTILLRKQAVRNSQIKFLASEVKIEKVCNDGEYFGISVNQDQRYVLGNYIVTHNTGIPAQADLMVMMGANEEYLKNNYRQINLPKNKLSGNHTYFRVKINPQLSRIEDV